MVKRFYRWIYYCFDMKALVVWSYSSPLPPLSMEKVMLSSVPQETSKTLKHLQPWICFSINIERIRPKPTAGDGDGKTDTETPTFLFSTWATRTWVCFPHVQKDLSKASSHRTVVTGIAECLHFYLSCSLQASGDYIGMALRKGALICIYKLGGVIQEVETKSQITTTTNVNSTDLDRVVFHRWAHMIVGFCGEHEPL